MLQGGQNALPQQLAVKDLCHNDINPFGQIPLRGWLAAATSGVRKLCLLKGHRAAVRARATAALACADHELVRPLLHDLDVLLQAIVGNCLPGCSHHGREHLTGKHRGLARGGYPNPLSCRRNFYQYLAARPSSGVPDSLMKAAAHRFGIVDADTLSLEGLAVAD